MKQKKVKAQVSRYRQGQAFRAAGVGSSEISR